MKQTITNKRTPEQSFLKRQWLLKKLPVLLNLKIHCRVQNTSSLVTVLSQMDLVNSPPPLPYLKSIVILPSHMSLGIKGIGGHLYRRLRKQQGDEDFRFSNQICYAFISTMHATFSTVSSSLILSP
jgi:hypothetical protein